MKKVLYFATLLLCMGLTSCEKEDIGGTATESMAGEWYVTVDAADANGNVVEGLEDPFGLGKIHVLTYNASDNNPNVLIVDDLENFWGFKAKTNCDQKTLSFSTSTSENNNLVAGYEDINVTITGGKIIKNGGVQSNGSKADYIEFYVSFSDDPYPGAYGYASYKVSGVRYSGLTEND